MDLNQQEEESHLIEVANHVLYNSRLTTDEGKKKLAHKDSDVKEKVRKFIKLMEPRVQSFRRKAADFGILNQQNNQAELTSPSQSVSNTEADIRKAICKNLKQNQLHYNLLQIHKHTIQEVATAMEVEASTLVSVVSPYVEELEEEMQTLKEIVEYTDENDEVKVEMEAKNTGGGRGGGGANNRNDLKNRGGGGGSNRNKGTGSSGKHTKRG